MVGHFQEFEDEYLEMMYEFHEQFPLKRVRTGDLAAKLGVKPASATEMIQRLASRDLLDYVPYKGAKLTEAGFVHGQQMKRRHRLAELLLDALPYEGNPHETACRLEHAIDDDLEVALSRMLGSHDTDPSGRPIPAASSKIQSRLDGVVAYASLEDVPPSSPCTVRLLLLDDSACLWLKERGVEPGVRVLWDGEALVMADNRRLVVDPNWARGVLMEHIGQ